MANIEKYKNGKIYKLYCDDYQWFYFGSTTDTLKNRFYGHKGRSKMCPDNKMYKIFNEIGWDKIKISLVEQVMCNSKFELNNKENEYIHKHFDNPNMLNIQHSCLKLENLNNDKYRNLNIHKTKNSTETKYIKQQKEYRYRTKEHKKEYDKQYIKINKEYIKERSKIEIKCNCGVVLTKSHYSRHKKSHIHINNLNNINNTSSPFRETNEPCH